MAETIQRLQNLRNELIQMINLQIDEAIFQVRNEEMPSEQISEFREYERFYPLTVATGVFKGKKPVCVVFQDGTRVNVPTWKRVVEAILKKCVEKQEYKDRLKELRGRIAGRERVLLASEPGQMRSPLMVERGIYMETHYDTESLLRILVTRILDEIQYDYSGIEIGVRNEGIA